ncbi:MAG TPA: glycine--tRNA ligase subunit beta [Bacilli bacterium]
MSKDLLLEIGMEEIPARFVRDAVEQLAQKTEEWLQNSRIAHASVIPYATPRRIAVYVRDVAEKQGDITEEAKGPAKKIAQDDQGNWTKAALGFARSQGVKPEELYFKEISGVEYAHARKHSVGVQTADILADGLKQLVLSLHFPKNMRWGSNDLKYVRPIRWLVALFGADVVDFAISGVRTGRVTRGHRFLGTETALAVANDYKEALRAQQVIVDIAERKAAIVAQIEQLAQANGWQVPMKADLLEEVLFLVEMPTALHGSFDPAFLSIPREVLITSMREHQRYFPVFSADGKLLPHFVTIRNGDSVSLDTVARGNEKVLRARLSDAKFFYVEDQKLSIDNALSRLETIVFHEELGTIGDKVRRIRAIAEALAEKLSLTGETAELVRRAAAICKFDLVTQMVYEFPELQGIMGEDYARKAGEKAEVARAIFEHYKPRFSGDSVPESPIGAIVSIADKIDTIAGCFSIGIVPTGSQDPYALRRQAAGIVQILLEKSLPLRLSELFAIALDVLERARGLKREHHEIVQDLTDFFGLRVKNLFSDRIRYDVADAVMAAGFDNVALTVQKGEALMQAVAGGGFKEAADALVRVGNLAQKAATAEFSAALFADRSERELYDSFLVQHGQFADALAQGNASSALYALTALREPINRYFAAVMVMVDDEALRNNRLGLLRAIADDISQFADFQKIVW